MEHAQVDLFVTLGNLMHHTINKLIKFIGRGIGYQGPTMDDSIWTLLYSVADTWVATTHQTNLMNQNKG